MQGTAFLSRAGSERLAPWGGSLSCFKPTGTAKPSQEPSDKMEYKT